MKKNTHRLLVLLIVGVVLLTGCGSKLTKEFTITCTGNSNIMEGIKQTNTSIYKFDKDQYVTEYEITTVSVYDSAEVYQIYKESTEETVKSNDSDTITYNVKGDDATKTLTFGYKVTINKEDFNKLEDKDFYKAINVLNRANTSGMQCTFDGITQEDIK